MSAMQRLRDSGLFRELDPQANASVCFQLIEGQRGASIYVLGHDQEAHVRVSALENGRFPNNHELHDFVRNHAHGMAHGEGNSAYSFRLAGERVAQVIEIIRSGL